MITEHELSQFRQNLATEKQPEWLQHLREQAWLRWQDKGLPSPRHERWKYTALDWLQQTDFSLENKNKTRDYETLLPPVLADSWRILLVDGELISSELPPHIDCASLTDTLKNQPEKIKSYLSQTHAHYDSIHDLNATFVKNGLVLFVPANYTLPQPIHLIHLYTQADEHMLHLQNLIHLAENSQLNLIEHHIGQDNSRSFSTLVNHIQLEKDASLNWYRWQEQGNASYHINRTYLQQAANSQLQSHSFDLGGRLLRNELFQEFKGEHASCHLHGLYLAKNKQQIDNYLNLEHRQPHCHSEQHFKGIIDDKAHAVFQGKVIVAPAAQKSVAHQHNANLILSAQAQIDTLPQLEIYADDVQCTHGAAVGQLDEAALFYLQSRGLPPATAKQILIYGFAADSLHAITDPALQQFSRQLLSAYFPDIELLSDFTP